MRPHAKSEEKIQPVLVTQRYDDRRVEPTTSLNHGQYERTMQRNRHWRAQTQPFINKR